MKTCRLIVLPALLAAVAVASAQEGVICTHPAGPSGGRMLTMEEVILSRGVRPDSGNLAEAAAMLSGDAVPGNVAVNRGRSLYWKDAAGLEHPVAVSEDDNITYGQTVSRNEFGISGGTFWSPDGTKLAFYRKDESLVTDFPLLDITTRTGSLKNIKYPMTGMDSERISLGIFDTATGKTVYVAADDFGDDRYLTNISWGPDGKNIFIQVLDRTQKHMRLNMYRVSDGSFAKTVLTEDNPKYVEPLDPVRFLDGGYHFIYRTNNRDGYRNLYLCDTLGTVRRITPCDADVAFAGLFGGTLYYTSAEVSPIENHLFRIQLSTAKGRKAVSAENTRIGKPVRLTKEEGWHDIAFSGDGKLFLDRWSSFNVPAEWALRTSDKLETVKSFKADDPLKDYATGEIIFGKVPAADGSCDNYYRLYKPKDFDPSKKYPAVVYVYGGPHSQMVTDSWLGNIRLWEEYMAQKGYVVYVQDNRGTENRGLAFEQAIHRHCGQAEMADQMVGVEMLRSLPWVDADRIGVHGWSYGGFMTISLMTNYPDVFKVGVAGGPVIDWKWYEIMYGERYMETMESNPEGFRQTSLINRVNDLKGKLLICQGAIDNTVVWEHSLSFVRECIKNNVQLDYFPYPCAEHNVLGKDRVHLMDKVTMYFQDYL